MSYILDALQRADAERARGGVPTLNARPLATPLAGNGLSKPQRAGIAIAGFLVVVVAALAWWWWWSRPVAQPAVATQPLAAVPAAATLVPLPGPATLPTRAVAAVTVAQPAPPSPTAAAEKPVTAASAAEPTALPQPKPKAVAAASAPVVAEVPSAAPALAPLLSELPEATRRQIPAMAISGAVYSENPSQRLLLVNGLVLNQGAQVAQDLTVVEIRSNNSEFNFRGTRFRVAH